MVDFETPVAEVLDGPDGLIAQAWHHAYLDPLRAREIGHHIAALGGTDAGPGWLHVALAEIRIGDVNLALQALARARALFNAAGDARGLTLCDEVQAIQLRRAGDYAGSARLQAEIDGRCGLQLTALDRFIAHNSRAITAKLLGRSDEALRHFHAAASEALGSGHLGARITALSNLGGYHQDLYNLDHARELSEQAFHAAREAGVKQSLVTSAVNLIVTYHASGLPEQARAMVEFLVQHPDELIPDTLQRYALPLALGHLSAGEIDAAQRYLDRGATSAVGDGDGVTLWAWLQTRCHLARGDAARARDVAETTLRDRERRRLSDQPYEMMELLRAAADACEAVGDSHAALAFVRRAQALYEQLVGRSARARHIALQARHDLTQAQRERDMALDSQRSVEDDRRRLEQLNEALRAKVAEAEMLHAKLREQALRDPLTGLHNRRYLFEIAPGLIALARRQNSPLSVVLIDLDHFKLLNDTFGHHAGDAVLQRFAGLLAQMLRRSDVVCRHGGEEFVVVMPDLDAQGAQAMLSRLLAAYRAQTQDIGRRRLPSCSFSAGIAVFPTQGHTLEQLLSRADRALYSAKSQGRARIESMPMTDFGTFS